MKFEDLCKPRCCSLCGQKSDIVAPFVCPGYKAMPVLVVCQECFGKRKNSYGSEINANAAVGIRLILNTVDFGYELESISGDKVVVDEFTKWMSSDAYEKPKGDDASASSGRGK